MNIDKLKGDHAAIALAISNLRQLVRSGVAAEASAIAAAIVNMSSAIKLHLTFEDMYLYPTLLASADAETVQAARAFQDEMGHLAEAYAAFAKKWSNATALASAPEVFRSEANDVFQALTRRIKMENEQLYVLAEAA